LLLAEGGFLSLVLLGFCEFFLVDRVGYVWVYSPDGEHFLLPMVYVKVDRLHQHKGCKAHAKIGEVGGA